jgi:hypothetical protein
MKTKEPGQHKAALARERSNYGLEITVNPGQEWVMKRDWRPQGTFQPQRGQ